jgi:hypothetical protein
MVVLGDFEQPLAGHVAAARDVFEKRQHLVPALGTSEGDKQQGVVG